MDSLQNDLDNVDVEASEKTPNIIFVQLESFFDPTHVKRNNFIRESAA